jgi:hypothetical protein
MFVISPDGDIRHVKRRPGNWDRLENWDNYQFIPETRSWDAVETEQIVKAIGLDDVYPNAAYSSNDRWLKRLTREFCRTRRLNLSAVPS